MTDWDTFTEELAAQRGLPIDDEENVVTGSPIAQVSWTEVADRRIVRRADGSFGQQVLIKWMGSTAEPERVWRATDDNGVTAPPFIGRPRAVVREWVGQEGSPLTAAEEVAYLEAEIQTRRIAADQVVTDVAGLPVPSSCLAGPIDFSLVPAAALPNGNVFAVLPTLADTTTAPISEGAAPGDLVQQVTEAGEVSDVEMVFPEPVWLRLSQGAEQGWFDASEQRTLTVNAGSWDVHNPTVTNLLLPGGAAPELAEVTVNGPVISFTPAAAGGHIEPAGSAWTLTTTEPVTSFTTRLASSEATEFQRGPIRVSVLCP